MNKNMNGNGKGKRVLAADDYVQGILSRDLGILSKAITLMESRHPDHQQMAKVVLEKILPHSGKSLRIGISGIPGAGKSTFIENFGQRLIGQGHSVAVLAVDPSSPITGGSILGDKTRMEKLSLEQNAFIRPSPSAGTLGGVNSRTRESIFVFEAAGFDRILVETMGVGQAEMEVAQMVDLFMVFLLPGAGDELQGIKRGILEMADIIIIHKADGENRQRALMAQKEYEGALRILRGKEDVKVVACSSVTQEGFEELDDFLLSSIGPDVRKTMEKKRREQLKKWMWSLIEQGLLEKFHKSQKVKELLPLLEERVLRGDIPPQTAADQALTSFC